MKFYITVLASLIITMSSKGQSVDFKEYSYTQFFDLIENEKDSIFSMSDALISYDKKTDSLFLKQTTSYQDRNNAIGSRKETLVIDKEIKLNNVHFKSSWFNQGGLDNGVINNVRFTKDVSIDNVINVNFFNCEFERKLTSRNRDQTIKAAEELNYNLNMVNFSIENSRLRSGTVVSYFLEEGEAGFRIVFENNQIWVDSSSEFQTEFDIFGRNIFQMWMTNNTFHGQGQVEYRSIKLEQNDVNQNTFDGPVHIFISENKGFDKVSIHDNFFQNKVFLQIDKLAHQYFISYQQFEGKLISGLIWDEYKFGEDTTGLNQWQKGYNPSANQMEDYLSRYLVENYKAHQGDKALRSLFYNYFKSKFDNESANLVYNEIKDLETKRMEYLYNKNPSFDTYFTWKTNQFLKTFSEYGTKPANAILFSLYVILLFALIYLFFPNSWDSNGKNRIMARYTFFMKYMNQKEGIHEVYLEDKEVEMMSYQKFRDFIESSEESVPRFFTATALPLYKWAISSTKLSAYLLKSIDIMGGTWNEVPKNKRWWKGLFLIGVFAVTIIYDITIKILNALMLSINTFTTLGFGEIPIKGLPRYLAIIQGFIGWFMLTIFSVSLISQLLN